jgi:festuclavine dehydrogenase
MTILLTGGTGDTGSHIARILHSRDIPFLVASRRGQSGVSQPYTGVQFDWDDATTFHYPFETDLAKESPITAVYLVCQIGNTSMLEKLRPFIDLAFKEKGVKRFVLLSASQIAKGGPYYGEVHTYFDEIGVEYAVLRPSWFFSEFPLTS